ncbi:MAG TPA: SPOR domain-containing protein, partial [Bacteroidales bacterium]|nr:SPOR domain-containing protein [Bacteroidales bacterium]
IYFDSGNNSKSRAYEVKHSFTLNYPDVDVYILFEAPYYKVRVGNFRTRLDAYSFFRKISAKYPDAFIVKDFIDYP